MTARPRSAEPDTRNTDVTSENGEPVQCSSDPSLKINQKKKSAHPFLPLLGPFRTGLMQYLLCFDQLEKPSIALRELICVPGIGEHHRDQACIWGSAEKKKCKSCCRLSQTSTPAILNYKFLGDWVSCQAANTLGAVSHGVFWHVYF